MRQADMQRHSEVILLKDKCSKRRSFAPQHKHNAGTDLEAPVVWLLLKGGA